MRALTLRGNVVVRNPLELALEFLEGYSSYDAGEPADPMSFGERDLRLANRGGARIAAAEIESILARQEEIEAALGVIRPGASLAAPVRSVPWRPLSRLFDAFAGIRGVGLSKTTKALHPKRPALVPLLDSVVQTYLLSEAPPAPLPDSFAARGTALVRAYKRDLDVNRAALQELRRELARRGHRLTEVRILDLVIWSVSVVS